MHKRVIDKARELLGADSNMSDEEIADFIEGTTYQSRIELHLIGQDLQAAFIERMSPVADAFAKALSRIRPFDTK